MAKSSSIIYVSLAVAIAGTVGSPSSFNVQLVSGAYDGSKLIWDATSIPWTPATTAAQLIDAINASPAAAGSSISSVKAYPVPGTDYVAIYILDDADRDGAEFQVVDSNFSAVHAPALVEAVSLARAQAAAQTPASIATGQRAAFAAGFAVAKLV